MHGVCFHPAAPGMPFPQIYAFLYPAHASQRFQSDKCLMTCHSSSWCGELWKFWQFSCLPWLVLSVGPPEVFVTPEAYTHIGTYTCLYVHICLYHISIHWSVYIACSLQQAFVSFISYCSSEHCGVWTIMTPTFAKRTLRFRETTWILPFPFCKPARPPGPHLLYSSSPERPARCPFVKWMNARVKSVNACECSCLITF